MLTLLGLVLGVSFSSQHSEVLGSVDFSVTVLDNSTISMNDLGYGVGEVVVQYDGKENRYLTFDDIEQAQVTMLADGTISTNLKLIDTAQAIALK